MSQGMICNPIIKGFNPDPSILRIDEDYYIATSTFEWHPGIQIHHSRDLMNWELIGHVLKTQEQLDMIGVPNSSGIWAPSLSYFGGVFYMVYTVVRTRLGPFKDLRNYLVTADSINGPWSEPVFLNSSGFDPSLFHDDDGRKWIVNVQWDYRPDQPSFGGVVLREYDVMTNQMTGPEAIILRKDVLVEGPNLYKHNGLYYLMLAQGGTGWEHSIAMARSKDIQGPYELDPQEVVLTSKHDPSLALQKAGHGELVQTPDGQWYLAHLCSRPVGEHRRCILGRETAIQKCVWNEEGWLRLDGGGVEPKVNVLAPRTTDNWQYAEKPRCDDFEDDRFGLHWVSLRRPVDDAWLSLSERKGWARIYGRESIHSLFEQSLIAQRLQSFKAVAEIRMQFKPMHYNHSAGLICWYDTENHCYLRVTYQEDKGIMLGIVLTDDGNYVELADAQIVLDDIKDIYLKAVIDTEQLQFYYSADGQSWQAVGPTLDMTKLSDDYADRLRFTGTMVGLCVQDLQGDGIFADFDYFELIEEGD